MPTNEQQKPMTELEVKQLCNRLLEINTPTDDDANDAVWLIRQLTAENAGLVAERKLLFSAFEGERKQFKSAQEGHDATIERMRAYAEPLRAQNAALTARVKELEKENLRAKLSDLTEINDLVVNRVDGDADGKGLPTAFTLSRGKLAERYIPEAQIAGLRDHLEWTLKQLEYEDQEAEKRGELHFHRDSGGYIEAKAALAQAGGPTHPQRTIPQHDTRRDWPEDFSHENGNYGHTCKDCGNGFVGNKRRHPLCKVCAMTPEPAGGKVGV